MLFSKRGKIALLLVIAPLLAFTSCASAPPPRKPTVSERIEFDRAIGTELAEQLTPQLSLRKEPQVQAYLTKIAQKLADKNPELHIPEAKVFILKDSGPRPKSYSLPGGRIYLSSAQLRSIEFENEAAAAISIELGHLLNEHVLNFLRKNPSGLRIRDAASIPGVLPLKTLDSSEEIDFFGKDGMFAFSARDNDEAVSSAVSILYDAGYDPRGLVTFLQRLVSHPGQSPWEETELQQNIEQARKSIALLTPLRNPVVQTDDFELIRVKLQKL